MPKLTRLNENAEIYQSRKHQTEKEKLSEMSFKKKLSYLWEYYKLHAFIIIAIVAIIISVVKNIITPNIETQLYAAVINSPIEAPVFEEYQEQFEEYLSMDPIHEEVVIDSKFYFDGTSEYSAAMRQALVTYIAAEDVDIIIAPESEFADYVFFGVFDTISDILPTDLYSSLTDKFYISSTEEDPDEENVYGIYISDFEFFKSNSAITPKEPYIIGIVTNSRHQDNSIEFIRYLLK
ncbi:MAG TPA: hypothetical protein VJ888_01405 [Mobilitalea sp.]|nr:hypothetical protein [Mobilitalea sp.]